MKLKMKMEERRTSRRSWCPVEVLCAVSDSLNSVASECPQEAAMRLQRLGREGCLALEFWQIQGPKIKLSQSTSHNRIKHKGTNRSSVILSHLPAVPSSDRASPFPSRHDRYDPTNFFLPAFQGLVLHAHGCKWDADLEIFMPAKSHNPHQDGERLGLGLGFTRCEFSCCAS